MAWTNNSAAIQTPENPATVAGAPMPTNDVPFFDASTFPPAIEHGEVTAEEAEEALAKFLETGNLYSVALHCGKSIETIERLFIQAEFKARLESAKAQLESLYVVFAERTLHEIASNKYMSEASRVKAASAILQRYDKKQDIQRLLERLEALEAARGEDDIELPPSMRPR